MAYTTATLLTSIKKRAAVPTSQSTFTDAEILDLASEALLDEILPKILQARQDFYVYVQSITPSLATGDLYKSVEIPSRAIGQSIIGVFDSEDDTLIDPQSYWVESNKLYFGDDLGTTTYRLKYYLRPNKLVETTDACTISTITNNGDGTTTIVVSATPPTDIVTGSTVDLIRSTAAYETLKVGIATTLVSGTSITFATTNIPSTLAVGDYIATAEETPVPQIPKEWQTYLAQWTAVEILESIGDYEAAVKASQRLPRLEKNALSTISPRAESKGKAIKVTPISTWR